MSTKECPSCGAEVPTSATRCKQCFHDFTEEPKRRISLAGPLALLASLAAMALVGSITLFVIVSRPVEERILVDEDTRSIVWTRKFRTGVETERLMFDEVIKLEYVLDSSGDFQIVAVDTNGGRHVVQSDKRPLKSEATHYASMMEKPLDQVDNTRGFGGGE